MNDCSHSSSSGFRQITNRCISMKFKWLHVCLSYGNKSWIQAGHTHRELTVCECCRMWLLSPKHTSDSCFLFLFHCHSVSKTAVKMCVCVCVLPQRCVGCSARTEVCVSGPTPATVPRAGWADCARSVSIRGRPFRRGTARESERLAKQVLAHNGAQRGAKRQSGERLFIFLRHWELLSSALCTKRSPTGLFVRPHVDEGVKEGQFLLGHSHFQGKIQRKRRQLVYFSQQKPKPIHTEWMVQWKRLHVWLLPWKNISWLWFLFSPFSLPGNYVYLLFFCHMFISTSYKIRYKLCVHVLKNRNISILHTFVYNY